MQRRKICLLGSSPKYLFRSGLEFLDVKQCKRGDLPVPLLSPGGRRGQGRGRGKALRDGPTERLALDVHAGIGLCTSA